MRQTEKIALVNGRIHTPGGIVSSVVLDAGRVVGELPAGDLNARVIDLQGRTVLPGFCDSDARLTRWAISQERAQQNGGRPFDAERPGDEDISFVLTAHASKIAALGITEIWADELPAFGYDFRRARGFFMDAAASGRLPFRLRLQMRFPAPESLTDYLADGWRTGDGVPFYQEGPVLCGMDGDKAEELARMAHSAGMQLSLDTSGGVDSALTLLERLQEERNVNSRHLLRCGALDEAQRERLFSLRAGAVTYPSGEGSNDASWLEMMRKGLVLSAGSGGDEGVQRPLDGIRAATSGQADARLSVAEALSLYTWNAAWNGRNERRRGTLAPGMDADLVVLDRDPFSAGADEPLEVALTICGGCVTYDALS